MVAKLLPVRQGKFHTGDHQVDRTKVCFSQRPRVLREQDIGALRENKLCGKCTDSSVKFYGLERALRNSRV